MYSRSCPNILSLTDLSSTELNQLTGIAAILTYPLDVEVVQSEEKLLKARAQGSTEESVMLDE